MYRFEIFYDRILLLDTDREDVNYITVYCTFFLYNLTVDP